MTIQTNFITNFITTLRKKESSPSDFGSRDCDCKNGRCSRCRHKPDGNAKRNTSTTVSTPFEFKDPAISVRAPKKACPGCLVKVANATRTCPHCTYKFGGAGFGRQKSDGVDADFLGAGSTASAASTVAARATQEVYRRFHTIATAAAAADHTSRAAADTSAGAGAAGADGADGSCEAG